MTMTAQQRIDSIEAIAAIIGQGDPSSVWAVLTHTKKGRPPSTQLQLTVTAGKKTWSACAAPEPREAGEKLCTEYLLRKMAHAAHLCPSCLGKVPRLPLHPVTNKTQRRMYRCPACMTSWRDS